MGTIVVICQMKSYFIKRRLFDYNIYRYKEELYSYEFTFKHQSTWIFFPLVINGTCLTIS